VRQHRKHDTVNRAETGAAAEHSRVQKGFDQRQDTFVTDPSTEPAEQGRVVDRVEIVSLEAVFLSTFVMIGQNRQAAFQQAKADHDFVAQ
jgi:hypothetical protein